MPSIFMRTASIVDPIVRLARTGAAAFLACLATLVFANTRRVLARAFGLLALCLGMGSTLAQTPVSGAISANTRWTVAGGPYVVTGELVVQNGAVLTIDPGVTAYMSAGASLNVQGGSIKAAGTQALPIKVLSEKTRLGGAAAAGDWKQWVFTPGPVNSQLDHVLFEHGSGLVVQGSAPILNFLNIRNQLGAAITVDLAASPSGIANQASGNILNGISVPGGDITGSVKWALRGIPYIVANGVVSVGATPTVSQFSPDSVQAGQTATINVTGTRLSGLSGAHFEIAGMSAQVLGGATDTQAALSVTAASTVASGPVTMRLLTNAGWSNPTNSLAVARAQPTLSSVTPSPVYVGQGTVELNVIGRDFTSQSAVLRDGMVLTTQFVSATQLRASVTVPAAAATLAIKVRTPDAANAGQFLLSNELALPVVIPQLSLTPANPTIIKGALKTLSVNLPYPAPAGGMSINLVSSVPSVASLPGTVLVPAGEKAVNVQLTGIDIGITTITASKTGLASGQSQVTVVTPPTLTLTPALSNLGVGRTVELTLTSSVPAGQGGLTVALNSSSAATATVAPSATIAAGASTAVVKISTLALGTTLIDAQAPDYVKASATVNVRPLSVNLPAGALVAPGLTRSIPVRLSDPAPTGGVVVTLVSANPAAATVPASITVPQGQTDANFILTGVGIGEALITAKASAHEPGLMKATVDAVKISFGNLSDSSLSLPVDVSRALAVTLSRPAPAGGVVVSMLSSDSAKAVVSPATITIAEGQTSGGVVMATVRGVSKGSATLSANAEGLTSGSLALTITGKPRLVFASSSSPTTVAKGMRTYASELRILRYTDDNRYYASEPVTVNLSSINPGKASVPATVVIAADTSEAYVYVTGIELTDAAGVTIDASVSGGVYSAPASKATVRVVAPVFDFNDLDKARTTNSDRDGFSLSINTPGAGYPGSQTAVGDMPIALSIVEGAPAGLVSGFFTASSAGTPVSQVVLKSGASTTDTVYIATPGATGSYKVQTRAFGATASTSPLVTVSMPGLKFSRTSVVAGKGMVSSSNWLTVFRVAGDTATPGVEALTLNLTSSDPSKLTVPATVTIDAGASSANVRYTGVELTGTSPVTISASASAYPTATVTATVVAPTLTVYASDTTRTPVSGRDDLWFSFEVPGASSQYAAKDEPINLAIVAANPADIVGDFYSAVSGGVAIKQFIMRAGTNDSDVVNGARPWVGTPAMAGTYRIQASAPGIGAVGLSELVTVLPPDLKFNRTTVLVGKGFNTYSAEVTVSRSVSGNGIVSDMPLTIALTSSDPSKVSVPATVTIPPGYAAVQLRVGGIDFTGTTPVTIGATAVGYKPAQLSAETVAPVFKFAELDIKRSPASMRNPFRLTVEVAGASYPTSQTAMNDLPIGLSIVDAKPAGTVDGFFNAATAGSAVTQMIIRKGESEVLSADAAYIATPATAGTYAVKASAAGIASTVSPMVTVTEPELRFYASSGTVIVGKGLTTHPSEVYVYRAANKIEFQGTAAVTVNLACTSTVICSVPPSVVIEAGKSRAAFTVTGMGLGNTTITATAVGYSASQDVPVSVIAPSMALSTPSRVAIGGTGHVSFSFNTPGANYGGSQTAAKDIVVNLTSSAPGVATVPASLMVKAGNTSSESTYVTGVSAGTTTVTASGSDINSVTSDVITVSP
ncbi:hypothetical protein [Massilia genomosp. 1]|uniref:IPT/TIG domain-containing protein n=1 Tax=Massilia genomosp. 1 TaxID=2609280 RepID=A0ABX0MTV9_9BURK|nr:hypothetical protein [Massilia genomosp. 1]NHZ66194.1 hypothetical protein [Massilia genomosp. 1]